MHASVEVNNKVRVKTEGGTVKELNLAVKIEPGAAEANNDNEKSEIVSTKSFPGKETLIKKIVGLKKECQQTTLLLNKKDAECKLLASEKEKMEINMTEKISSLSAKVKSLQGEIANTKREHSKLKSDVDKRLSTWATSNYLQQVRLKQLTDIVDEQSKLKSDDEKRISTLAASNRLLKAQLKQIQAGVHQKQTFEANSVQSKTGINNVFAADKIVAHKKKRDGIHFRVRWANFSSDDDTWEHESNILSQELLDEYKQNHKINLK